MHSTQTVQRSPEEMSFPQCKAKQGLISTQFNSVYPEPREHNIHPCYRETAAPSIRFSSLSTQIISSVYRIKPVKRSGERMWKYRDDRIPISFAWLTLSIILRSSVFGSMSSVMELWHVTSEKRWRKKANWGWVWVWVENSGLKLDLWQNLFGVRHNETGFINWEKDLWAHRWWLNRIKHGFSHVTVITDGS